MKVHLEWREANNLIDELRSVDYRFCLLVAVGCYTGLRCGDILRLRWDDLCSEVLVLSEGKTGKIRKIKLNARLLTLVKGVKGNREGFIFVNRIGVPMSIQYVNQRLKWFRVEYNLDIDNFSSHGLRKTFGRHVWENDDYSERALVMLSEIFNHSSISITKRYLAITQDEMFEVYDLL